MILTAKPSITAKEINYVTDAITNGHGEHWGDYIKYFEKMFAKYIGVKHAMTTSSCTGAMHLCLVAMGIGKGDEVIIPDMTWIATASAVCYTGAKPVFVDILPDTWCIDPERIEGKITKNTKAIIPVHLYGNVAEMDAINKIADQYGLKVIEDAAPSVGCEYHYKKTGSLGDAGCFSFQGAKMLSTGEGGMITTDDSDLFDKIKHYAEHGRVSLGFDISDIGFKYKMSNLQAAWGLAQLERIDELLLKRKLIFSWYREKLLCSMNPVVGKVVPNYWMISVVKHWDRDKVMQRLRDKEIDTRPFFPQVSSYKMFDTCDNFVAKYIGKMGINLPSYHDLTKEEVTYICNCVNNE